MISLTIEDTSRMTKQDAAALRAIADAYHPSMRNQDMDVGTLKNAIQRGMPGALTTLAELNAAAPGRVVTGEPVGVQTFAPPPEALSGAVPSTGDVFLDSAADLGRLFVASAQKTADRLGVDATAKLHPHDNPATGAPDAHDVFSGGAVDIPTSENVKTIIAQPAIAPLPPGSGERHEWTHSEPDPAALFSGGGLPSTPAALISGDGIAAGMIAIGGTIPASAIPTHLVGETPSEAIASPNVQSGTPTPQPLPTATVQTSQQPSDAATSASPPPPPPPALAQGNASDGAVTTSPAPNSTEVDITGLPWDGRIHASTKTKTAKNVWTRRRGVEDEVFNRVETQLRAAMAIPTPAPAATPTDTPAAVTPPTVTDQAPTFPTLMAFITERISTQRLNQAQVQAAVQAVGLESLNLVMARPDLIPGILVELQKVAP